MTMTISENEKNKLYEIIIAALLHDIGKFAQRADMNEQAIHGEETGGRYV